MTRRMLAGLAGTMLVAFTAAAADVWVVHGSAFGPSVPCDASYVWTTETLLHNTTTADQQITVLHQNGAVTLPQAITVRAGESLPLNSMSGDIAPAGLFAVRLDVPAGVVVEPRLEYRAASTCGGVPPPLGPSGKIGMPAFGLTEANQPQRHFGLDLGIQPSRVNVGVYNAGTRAATATIELRRAACNDATTTMVTVPPDTLVQVTARMPPVCAAPLFSRTPSWIVNGTVIVDQPSFTYATPLSNVQRPVISFGVGSR